MYIRTIVSRCNPHVNVSSTLASLVQHEKSYFLMISKNFHCFRLCKHMCNHALAGQNTQQILNDKILFIHIEIPDSP